MTKDTLVENEIPVEVYDLTANAIGFAPGYYYNIPLGDDERVHPSEVALAGPYETKALALEAARAFITDCLNEGD